MNKAQPSTPDATESEQPIVNEAFRAFILEENHPCLMAQSLFRMKQYELNLYRDFGSRPTAEQILEDLKNYIARYDFNSNDFFSFIAVFNVETELSELKFERLLWQQLQELHEADGSD